MAEPILILSSVKDAQDQNREFQDLLTTGGYDFVDFGCSQGGSIIEAERIMPGARGLGIDIDPEKVVATRTAGFDAIQVDARFLRTSGPQVRFAILSHFLEHLPSVGDANLCLRSAAQIASDFVMVRQPSFDADGYLFSKGLKTYWSDWHGHPNRMSSLELQLAFEDLLRRGEINRYAIFLTGKVVNGRHPSIHPLASPPDQGEYDRHKHPAKAASILPFLRPVYTELHGIAAIDETSFVFELFKREYPDAKRIYASPDLSAGT